MCIIVTTIGFFKVATFSQCPGVEDECCLKFMANDVKIRTPVLSHMANTFVHSMILVPAFKDWDEDQ